MSVEINDQNPKRDGSDTSNSQYVTTDIEMAATLLSIGHKFVEIGERREKRTRRATFVFSHNMVRADLTKWFNGELSVDPRVLLNNLSDLKNLVHNKGFI